MCERGIGIRSAWSSSCDIWILITSFATDERAGKKTNTISQCYRMKQAEQINRTTNISHGTSKQDNTRRETPVNERKINDRITENSGRKTVFPISFGISCSWNWQSLALPHTHTLAHSLSLCRWARIGTSDFSFSRLQSIGLFFDFRRLLFFSRLLRCLLLMMLLSSSFTTIDFRISQLEASFIFSSFSLVVEEHRCFGIKLWHHILILWSTLTSHILLFFTTQKMCAVVAIREYRLIFIAIRAPSANLHTHKHKFCYDDSVYITCRKCVSCTINPWNLYLLLFGPFRCKIERRALLSVYAMCVLVFACVPNWHSSQIKLNEIVSL